MRRKVLYLLILTIFLGCKDPLSDYHTKEFEMPEKLIGWWEKKSNDSTSFSFERDHIFYTSDNLSYSFFPSDYDQKSTTPFKIENDFKILEVEFIYDEKIQITETYKNSDLNFKDVYYKRGYEIPPEEEQGKSDKEICSIDDIRLDGKFSYYTSWKTPSSRKYWHEIYTFSVGNSIVNNWVKTAYITGYDTHIYDIDYEIQIENGKYRKRLKDSNNWSEWKKIFFNKEEDKLYIDKKWFEKI